MAIIDTIEENLRLLHPTHPNIHTVEGTYGLVFVLEANETNVIPKKACYKTVNPKNIETSQDTDLQGLFERELRLWLEIRSHRNVLKASRIEILSCDALPSRQLPLVMMPYRDGTLREWIDDHNAIRREDLLLVLAHMCNGLAWLYSEGIQGHGDLKPENVLLHNLGARFALNEEGVLSRRHPWSACIADLGWADIWRELQGEYLRGWRPYVAPERFSGQFIPIQSDTFAVAVIACELLQGFHPAGATTEKVASWKPSKWKRWARKGDRDLSGVPEAQLQNLLHECLHPDPDSRPSHEVVLRTFCDVLSKDYGLEALSVLDCWNEEARANRKHRTQALAAIELSKIGGPQYELELDRIKQLMTENCQLESEEEVDAWVRAADTLLDVFLMAKRNEDPSASYIEETVDVCKRILDFVLSHFAEIDLRREFWGTSALSGTEAWEASRFVVRKAIRVLKNLLGESSPVTVGYEERLDAWMEPIEIEQWVDALRNPELSPVSELFIAKTIADYGEKALPDLEILLEDKDATVQSKAKRLIDRIRGVE